MARQVNIMKAIISIFKLKVIVWIVQDQRKGQLSCNKPFPHVFNNMESLPIVEEVFHMHMLVHFKHCWPRPIQWQRSTTIWTGNLNRNFSYTTSTNIDTAFHTSCNGWQTIDLLHSEQTLANVSFLLGMDSSWSTESIRLHAVWTNPGSKKCMSL